MNYIILIIAGIAGVALGTYLGRRRKESLIEKQAREKKENKRKILGFFESRDKAANNDIEALLGVSDATATRYLDELEKEGLIRQVGRTGKHVYYEKSNGSTADSR